MGGGGAGGGGLGGWGRWRGFLWGGGVWLGSGGMGKLPEFYVAVDVEADGPIPGPYSMISLGMAVVGRDDLRFYTELRPISDEFVPEALAVSGLDRDRLVREAPEA